MSPSKLIGLVGIIAALALGVSGIAQAGGSQGFSIKVIPQTSFVSPGQAVSVSISSVNNTNNDVTCVISFVGTGYSTLPFTLFAHNSANTGLGAPVNAKNSMQEADLICNGVLVASDKYNVKVR
ncbi:hypothetical protein KW803_01125 [Candidatus Saccharibacteria bacterium]|nr:hypothetical protein [Candidatus Saccharibacteria bacterium]